MVGLVGTLEELGWKQVSSFKSTASTQYAQAGEVQRRVWQY